MIQQTLTKKPAAVGISEILAGDIANYTPHAVTIFGENHKKIAVFPPTKHVARAREGEQKISEVKLPNGSHINVVKTHYGKPVDLPAPKKGRYIIVSPLTAVAAKETGRALYDLLMPSHLVRDKVGEIIGCHQLTVLD